jgi:tripartite-type tricarboxylate transporter receptor subunit TctC
VNLDKFLIAVGLAFSFSGVMAQNYPARPIRMIAPLPAASGADIIARMLGEKMTDILGKPVIADKRSGASGIIGAELAAKSVPDGYTLILCNVATHAINVNVVRNLSYHPGGQEIQTTFFTIRNYVAGQASGQSRGVR